MRSSFWVKGAFAVSILWWVYLFFTTQFVVVFDSLGYEDSGRMIAHHGWVEYLRSGLQREPMFPWLVSLSMHAGDWWGISYDYPLKMIGILFLFLTMVFSYRLMNMLSVRPFIAALGLLYMGLSPVMTNSSMRLWSEFAAYPWVVLAVIWTVKSWKLMDIVSDDHRENMRIVGHAGMVALMFLLIMSVKAVAEGVLLFYLWPFYWKIVVYVRSRNFIKARQAAIFCLTVLILFEGTVCAYKFCNYHYNGHFAFTNRGDWAFYGNTARRMQPLTPESLGAALATVPGMGLCTSIYSREDCFYWSAQHSDEIISEKFSDLSKRGIKMDAASNDFIFSSVKMILSNPLQNVLLMFIEAHKMFFWESSLSFVAYPDWVDKSICSTGVLYTLRVIFAFLSWIACVSVFCFLCFRRQNGRLKDEGRRQVLFWTFNFIFWYMAMYSLFFIVDRYSFPVVSLFMVLITFLMDKITRPVPRSRKG